MLRRKIKVGEGTDSHREPRDTEPSISGSSSEGVAQEQTPGWQ